MFDAIRELFERLFGSNPPSGGGVAVPELDPTSASTAIVLLLGAVLLIHRSRSRA